MRIVIISDVHANLAALESIREPYDLLLCLGDLVDYGPQPRETFRWMRERALRVIRGNHDHALASGVDCRCAPVMREPSVTTRQWHSRLLSPDDKEYLRGLPITERLEIAGATFHLAHAAPSGDLYDYHIIPDAPDEAVAEAIDGIAADFILLGLTRTCPCCAQSAERRSLIPAAWGSRAMGMLGQVTPFAKMEKSRFTEALMTSAGR